jgi:hypothetical protein
MSNYNFQDPQLNSLLSQSRTRWAESKGPSSFVSLSCYQRLRPVGVCTIGTRLFNPQYAQQPIFDNQGRDRQWYTHYRESISGELGLGSHRLRMRNVVVSTKDLYGYGKILGHKLPDKSFSSSLPANWECENFKEGCICVEHKPITGSQAVISARV